MAWFDSHFLTTLVFLPLAWAFAGLLIPGKGLAKIWAVAGSLVTFLACVLVVRRFEATGGEFQMMETVKWVPEFGIVYAIGVDGISLWLLLLTTFLMPLAILSSFRAIEERVREYYFLILSLETALLGAFVSLDLFLFYFFWEAMLIPMYFLIGVWGGPKRIYAATKFFLFTVVGSLLMLVAVFYLAYQYKVQFGSYSTQLLDLYKVKLQDGTFMSPQSLVFLAFALAFAIKVPLFPLHTWLPDAHVEAPTAGSVVLAAILLKMGGYGFLRFAFPLLPGGVAYFQVPFMILGAVAVVYGACVALVQPDMKKLVAYSSVSHMGYVILGLFALNATAVSGAYYQMLSHGVSTGALFLLVGFLYERRHTREIASFGGIARIIPVFAVVLMIISLSSLALPGTNGFVGEFLVLLGTWKTSHALAAVGGLGAIFGAVYMLWMVQRVMFGEVTHKENETLRDLSVREMVVVLPLVACVIFMGLFPNYFFRKLNPSVERLLNRSQVQTQSVESDKGEDAE